MVKVLYHWHRYNMYKHKLCYCDSTICHNGNAHHKQIWLRYCIIGIDVTRTSCILHLHGLKATGYHDTLNSLLDPRDDRREKTRLEYQNQVFLFKLQQSFMR
jgi:hypothetical protein